MLDVFEKLQKIPWKDLGSLDNSQFIFSDSEKSKA